MSALLAKHRAREYLTVGMLISLVTIFGLWSMYAEEDITIILAIAITTCLGLFYVKTIEPVHILYCLCLGCTFLPYINLKMFPLAGVYVIAFLLIFFALITFVYNRQRPIISPQAKWLGAFLALGVLSMAVAPDKKEAVIYLGQFFVYVCVYLVAINILDTKAKIVRALQYVIAGSVITILLSAVQFLISLISIQKVVDIFFETSIGEFFVGTKGLERIGDSAILLLNRGSNVAEASDLTLFRVFGPFEGPTIFGWYLLVICLLVGGLFAVQHGKKYVGLKKYSGAVLFFALVCCLVLTWTRSALLAFIFAFSFILIYRKKKSIRIFTPAVIRFLQMSTGVILVVIGFFLLFQIPFPTQIIGAFNVQRLGGSAIARLLTILFAMSYIYQHPLMGIGIGNYKYVQPGVDADAAGASFATAHNTYLELGVELGLPGLIIFICILCSFIRQAAALVKATTGSFYHTLGITFTGIWIGFALVSLFGGNLVHPRFMTLLWILAGIQTASYYLFLDEKEKENTIYRLEVAH